MEIFCELMFKWLLTWFCLHIPENSFTPTIHSYQLDNQFDNSNLQPLSLSPLEPPLTRPLSYLLRGVQLLFSPPVLHIYSLDFSVVQRFIFAWSWYPVSCYFSCFILSQIICFSESLNGGNLKNGANLFEKLYEVFSKIGAHKSQAQDTSALSYCTL